MKKILFLFSIVLLFAGCEVEKIHYTTALVYTYEPENILTNSASLGGTVIAEGGKDVTEYGLVWSTNPVPTVNDHKVAVGERLGDFFNNYSGFQPATTYYYAAYAINEIGTSYGDIYSFTTTEEAPCNPAQNNSINFGSGNLNINNVAVSYPSWGFNEGNIEFETSSNASTAQIVVQFNENGSSYPQTGTYTVVDTDTFGNGINLSTGEAKLKIVNYGLSAPASAVAASGTKFYVKNENNTITIIFCSTTVGSTVLNGKFSKNF